MTQIMTDVLLPLWFLWTLGLENRGPKTEVKFLRQNECSITVF